jgi:hypothetical protein
VREEHRERKLAAVLCLGSVGDIGGSIHVPGIGAKKAAIKKVPSLGRFSR